MVSMLDGWGKLKCYQKAFSSPFLIRKVSHPAVTRVFKVHCTVMDSWSDYSNEYSNGLKLYYSEIRILQPTGIIF